MRPDKPGLYWWEDDIGCCHVIEFVNGMKSLHFRNSVDEIERSFFFKRWIGQANPPKKVDRYQAGMLPMDLPIKPYERGPLVLYDDVKEFLLKGDENG
jgi:hypothetical protein